MRKVWRTLLAIAFFAFLCYSFYHWGVKASSFLIASISVLIGWMVYRFNMPKLSLEGYELSAKTNGSEEFHLVLRNVGNSPLTIERLTLLGDSSATLQGFQRFRDGYKVSGFPVGSEKTTFFEGVRLGKDDYVVFRLDNGSGEAGDFLEGETVKNASAFLEEGPEGLEIEFSDMSGLWHNQQFVTRDCLKMSQVDFKGLSDFRRKFLLWKLEMMKRLYRF